MATYHPALNSLGKVATRLHPMLTNSEEHRRVFPEPPLIAFRRCKNLKDMLVRARLSSYNLRHGNDSQIPKVHTTTHGIETISFLGNRLWSTLPNIVKQASTLPIFKNHIKCWKGENCHCRLCKTYIPQVGYLT